MLYVQLDNLIWMKSIYLFKKLKPDFDMKVCDVKFDYNQFRLNINYLLEDSLDLKFIISDLVIDCTYYILDVTLTLKSSIWIDPLPLHLVDKIKNNKHFGGIRCKIYNKTKLIQIENFEFNIQFNSEIPRLLTNQFDCVGASYIDFFYGNLCNGMDMSGVVIDAGANVGFFTLYALHKGASRVYAIEPDVDAYFYLSENFKDNASVILINKALASHCNGFNFYTNLSDSVASSNYIKCDNSIESFIETVNLDVILSINGKINILKLDIEGTEFEVIEHLNEHHFNKINQMFIEFHYNTPHRIVDRLNQFGYITEFRDCNIDSTSGFIYASR